MRPPSPTRRIAKWTGLGVCVVILAMWSVSLRWTVERISGRGWLGLVPGGVRLVLWSPRYPDSVRWYGGKRPPRRHMWIPTAKSGSMVRYTRSGWADPRFPRQQYFRANIPAWLPFTLATIPTAILWHRDRRTVGPGCCLTCGYDLRASRKICPECGSTIA